jgi:hypothetical protein
VPPGDEQPEVDINASATSTTCLVYRMESLRVFILLESAQYKRAPGRAGFGS